MVSRGWREEGMGNWCAVGMRFQVCKMKSVLWMGGGDGCTTV